MGMRIHIPDCKCPVCKAKRNAGIELHNYRTKESLAKSIASAHSFIVGYPKTKGNIL